MHKKKREALLREGDCHGGGRQDLQRQENAGTCSGLGTQGHKKDIIAIRQHWEKSNGSGGKKGGRPEGEKRATLLQKRGYETGRKKRQGEKRGV